MSNLEQIRGGERQYSLDEGRGVDVSQQLLRDLALALAQKLPPGSIDPSTVDAGVSAVSEEGREYLKAEPITKASQAEAEEADVRAAVARALAAGVPLSAVGEPGAPAEEGPSANASAVVEWSALPGPDLFTGQPREVEEILRDVFLTLAEHASVCIPPLPPSPPPLCLPLTVRSRPPLAGWRARPSD